MVLVMECIDEQNAKYFQEDFKELLVEALQMITQIMQDDKVDSFV